MTRPKPELVTAKQGQVEVGVARTTGWGWVTPHLLQPVIAARYRGSALNDWDTQGGAEPNHNLWSERPQPQPDPAWQ